MRRSLAFQHRLVAAFLRPGSGARHPGNDLAHLSDRTLRDIGFEPDRILRRTPDPMLLRRPG
jgi:hypothetical protein